jgi:hypothetical protein
MNKQFLREGYTVVPQHTLAHLPPQLWEKVANVVASGKARELERELPYRPEHLDEGGPTHAFLIDTMALGLLGDDIKDALFDAYAWMVGPLRTLTGLDVQLSPFARSKVTIKQYPAVTGQQGWHYDTNGLTVLTYLTDGGGGTEFYPLSNVRMLDGKYLGPSTIQLPRAGDTLIMRGRLVRHRALIGDVPKQVICWNYYEGGDCWRPEHMDATVYG